MLRLSHLWLKESLAIVVSEIHALPSPAPALDSAMVLVRAEKQPVELEPFLSAGPGMVPEC